MGARIFGVITLFIIGGMAADVLIHPAGTTAAGNALAGLWKPGLNAVLGQTS